MYASYYHAQMTAGKYKHLCRNTTAANWIRTYVYDEWNFLYISILVKRFFTKNRNLRLSEVTTFFWLWLFTSTK